MGVTPFPPHTHPLAGGGCFPCTGDEGTRAKPLPGSTQGQPDPMKGGGGPDSLGPKEGDTGGGCLHQSVLHSTGWMGETWGHPPQHLPLASGLRRAGMARGEDGGEERRGGDPAGSLRAAGAGGAQRCSAPPSLAAPAGRERLPPPRPPPHRRGCRHRPCAERVPAARSSAPHPELASAWLYFLLILSRF